MYKSVWRGHREYNEDRERAAGWSSVDGQPTDQSLADR